MKQDCMLIILLNNFYNLQINPPPGLTDHQSHSSSLPTLRFDFFPFRPSRDHLGTLVSLAPQVSQPPQGKGFLLPVPRGTQGVVNLPESPRVHYSNTSSGRPLRCSAKSSRIPCLRQYSGSLYEYRWTKLPTGSHVSSPGAAPSH